MICRCLAVACTLLITVAGAEAGAEPQRCVTDAYDSRLSLSTWRNASGHWLAALRVECSDLVGRPSRRLTLDVDPSSWRCGTTRTDAVTVHIQGSPPPPGPGYVKLAGEGFYKVHLELRNWDGAKAACEDEDAHLLIINSPAEANAILELIKRTPDLTSTRIHIGFNDRGQEGRYVTIFGETLEEAGYSLWESGNPTHRSAEHCGAIDKEVKLADYECEAKLPFICEHNFSQLFESNNNYTN